jgi:tetratricopeptide (TPR) repeat protein
LLAYIGFVQRRQGKFEQAVANFKKASELDPLSNQIAREFAWVLRLLREYPEAESYYDRAISLAPDIWIPYLGKAWLYILSGSSTDRARRLLEKASQYVRPSENVYLAHRLVELDVYDRDYQAALDRLSSIPEEEVIDNQVHFLPKAIRYAQIYGYMNRKELEQAHYDSAQRFLEAKVQDRPADARLRSTLGIAYAGLGRKDDAIREGKLGVELLPVSKDAMIGPSRVEDLANIYVMVGEFDAAIDQLEVLLSIPADISIDLLRLDPAWDPLRDHLRFKRLLEEGSK